MRYQVHLRPWVRWWIYAGIVCGIIALVNILSRDDLSPLDIAMIIGIGALFWGMLGIAAYGYGGVRIIPAPPADHDHVEMRKPPQEEWHAASDFLFPGNRKSLLPPKH
jgi:hypothetical protein